MRLSSIPCGSESARDGCVSGGMDFDGVHIRFCGNGHLWFRSYSGSLGKAPSNQGLLPLTFGASPWLGMPSLRSCSVGPPPSAIHGRGQLTRHPCRVAHCAEPALGLTRGRTPQQRPRRPAGRPGCSVRSSVMYLVDWKAAIASKLACMFRLEGVGGTKSSIPTLASTDRGRFLLPPFLPKSADKEFIGKTDDRGKPAPTVDRRTPTLLTTHQAER